MASETLDQRLAGMAPDQEIEILTNPFEVEFMRTWRAADDEGKRFMDRALKAAGAGQLPPVNVIEAMTYAERRAFMDSLPEVSP